MVNHSTNFNKTNKHFSPQIIQHIKTMTNNVGNPGPVLGHTEIVVGLNQLM